MGDLFGGGAEIAIEKKDQKQGDYKESGDQGDQNKANDLFFPGGNDRLWPHLHSSPLSSPLFSSPVGWEKKTGFPDGHYPLNDSRATMEKRCHFGERSEDAISPIFYGYGYFAALAMTPASI
jgi:hypothetical protein